MIRVEPAPEPADFEEQVRRPGLSAIAELVGGEPTVKRPGPRREKIAERHEAIPSDKLPAYWTRALGDLLEAYQHICAYMSIYIERVTGAASVDHMIAKSQAWDQVYEWSNYRLACVLMNSRKGVVAAVLDPFEIEDGWFALELTGFQVVAAEGLGPVIRERVRQTIDLLGLNDGACRAIREEYATDYWEGFIRLAYLDRRAPFVARELRRQGRLGTEEE